GGGVGTVGSGRRRERDAGGADVVGEDAAELVVLDLADEGRAGAEAGHPDGRVGGRTARDLHRRTHRVVDHVRALLVDKLHASLAHALADQEIIFRLRQHVDDCIADAENIETGCGHGNSVWRERRAPSPRRAWRRNCSTTTTLSRASICYNARGGRTCRWRAMSPRSAAQPCCRECLASSVTC